MDFRKISSAVQGTVANLDSNVNDWLGFPDSIAWFLQDEEKMIELANSATAHGLAAEFVDDIVAHIQTITEARVKIAEGDADAKEIYQKAMVKLGDAVFRSRKAQAQNLADFNELDAKERKEATLISAKSSTKLQIIAKQLAIGLDGEAAILSAALEAEDSKLGIAQNRAADTRSLAERKKGLRERIRKGTANYLEPGKTLQLPVAEPNRRLGGFAGFGNIGEAFSGWLNGFRQGMQG